MRPLVTPRRRQAGFTIMELMVATTIFSIVLLVITVGVMHFSHDYYKGITSNSTQAVARAVINDVAQNIQFGRTVTTGLGDDSGPTGFCIDNTLYSYTIGDEVAPTDNPAQHQARFGLIKSVGGSSCAGSTPLNVADPSTTLTSSDSDLLGDNMRLAALDVTSGDNNTYVVHVRVLYGDDDLLLDTDSGKLLSEESYDWSNPSAVTCASTAGSQFCAVSDLTTTVQQRLAE